MDSAHSGFNKSESWSLWLTDHICFKLATIISQHKQASHKSHLLRQKDIANASPYAQLTITPVKTWVYHQLLVYLLCEIWSVLMVSRLHLSLILFFFYWPKLEWKYLILSCTCSKLLLMMYNGSLMWCSLDLLYL